MASNRLKLNSKHLVLLELVRAGLWEKEVCLSHYGDIDFSAICLMAEKQGVLGLVVAGLELADVKPLQGDVLNIVGSVLQIEQQNKAMNAFIAALVEKMRAVDIYTLLVKGQGVAQCYERPLWRPSGDIDFLLSRNNYKKAKALLLPLSSGNKDEERYSQHLGMSIRQWYVEIHGSLRTGLSAKVDKEVDAAQNSVFVGGNVRSWQNGGTQVFLPAPTEDVFLVFTHFIKHFYKEGMSLRQLCDWCRLLYTYRESLNHGLLESWIRKSGLMKEWRAFGALAVNWLGMPETAMPFYGVRSKMDDVRGDKLVLFILRGYSGNKLKDTWRIAKIFPWKAVLYAPSIFLNVNWLKVKERIFKR